MKSRIKKFLLRSTVILGIAGAGYSAPAYAQSAEDNVTDEIIVTGSRIVRKNNYTSVGPINTIGTDDIKISARGSLGDLLEELPSVASVGDGTSVNNGSNGAQNINLRGLGSERVLVLMNGRRVSPVGTGINNTVDLQLFPEIAIERIEVLKDGAAAVYGADAISGVVNVITRTDFEGVELNSRIGTSEQGDGEEYQLGIIMGVANEKGSLTGTLSYSAQEGVFQADREISECPRLEPGVALAFGFDDAFNTCSGSSFTPEGRFDPAGDSNTVAADGTVRPFDFFGGDAYNFNTLNYLRTPNTVLSGYVTGTYDLTDNITANLEFLYNKRTSKQDLAPVPLGQGAQFTYGLIIPGNNPFNVTNPGQDIEYRKRALDLGARLFEQESDTIRIAGELEGTLSDKIEIPFFSGASWNVSFTGDYNNGTDKNDNLVNMLNVQNALDVETTTTSGAGTVTVGGTNYRCADAVARSLGCTPLNLFGPNSITPEAAEYIRLNTVNAFSTSGTVAQVVLSNSVFDLPAGSVNAVIGAERRTLEGSRDIDSAIENGFSSGNPEQSTSGEINAYDYFAEIEVPLLADRPGFEELTFNGAYRISDYDSFEAGNTYRANLAWSPVQGLRFRGGIATSYRTPSLSNLFDGGSGDFPSYNDPCTSSDPDTLAATTAAGICAAQGVTPGVFSTSNVQVLSFTTGARIVGDELSAERGRTKTLGAVWQPVSGKLADLNFEAALDYYDITVRDSITTTGAQNTIDNCYVDGSASDCALVTRATGGDILRVDTFFENADSSEVETAEGIDFSFRGSKEAFNGDITLDVRGTYLLENIGEDDNGDLVDLTGLCTGFTSACYNDWRTNVSLSYATDNFRAVWSTRFLSGIDENYSSFLSDSFDRQGVIDYFVNDYGLAAADVEGVTDAYFIDDYFYHDVNVRYATDSGIEISAGIDNVFDKDAPLYKSLEGFFEPVENTPIGTYDTRGRFFYVGIDKTF